MISLKTYQFLRKGLSLEDISALLNMKLTMQAPRIEDKILWQKGVR